MGLEEGILDIDMVDMLNFSKLWNETLVDNWFVITSC